MEVARNSILMKTDDKAKGESVFNILTIFMLN